MAPTAPDVASLTCQKCPARGTGAPLSDLERDPVQGIPDTLRVGVGVSGEVRQIGMTHRLSPGLRVGDPGELDGE